MVMIEWFDGSRTELADLFALADDSPAQVERYRDLGRVLVARDGPAVIGHLQLIPGERAAEAEVKSLAVRENRQGTGIGRRLMEQAVAVCREDNFSVLLVATAAADTRALRFYQRLGFRFVRVERDVFTPEAGYPPIEVDGVPLRDRVWLSLTLQNPDRSGAQAHLMQLRVARHTERLDELVRFYRDGLGLVEVGAFRDHNGYDGVFLEVPGTGTHIELTTGGGHGAPCRIRNPCSCSISATRRRYRRSRPASGSTRSPPPAPTGLSTEPRSPTQTDSTSFSCLNGGHPRTCNSRGSRGRSPMQHTVCATPPVGVG